MKINKHDKPKGRIAEIITNQIIIRNSEEAIDLIGNIYYQGFAGMIINEKNLTDQFYSLGNGLAGELFQKFSNYRMKLAIVGFWPSYTSKSLNDLIFECNNGAQIFFVSSNEQAIEVLHKKM